MEILKLTVLRIFIAIRNIINKLNDKIFNNKNEYKESYNYLIKVSDISKLKPASGILREIQLNQLNFAKELCDLFEDYGIKPVLGYGSLLGAIRHKGFIPWDDDIDFNLIREEYQKLIELAKEKFIYIKRPMNRYWGMYKTLAFEDKLLGKYPDKLIFIHSFNMLQVYRGTSLKDYRMCDFFPLDYYADDYDYQQHLLYIKKLKKQLKLINNYAKEIDYLENERKINPNIDINGNKIFYGIDNAATFSSLIKPSDWLYKTDFYPLKKVKFEDTEFWAPNEPERFLKNLYGAWRDFPRIIEEPHHLKYIDKYNKKQK